MKIIEQWLIFKYVDGEFTPLLEPFNTKAAAEKARLKLPEREQREVVVGAIRIKRYATLWTQATAVESKLRYHLCSVRFL